jgi:hypothetical protein
MNNSFLIFSCWHRGRDIICSSLQKCTNKTLTTGHFGNTCEADEVSPEVEEGVVAGLKCIEPSWDIDI